MSQETNQEHISRRVVVYRPAEMNDVRIRRDIEYQVTDAGTLTMDIYYPPKANIEPRTPAVVIVSGFPDLGFQQKVGCRFKDMASSVSWAKLIAAFGLAAITYTNDEPAADVRSLLEYVRRNATQLGIDENRMGLWASSGNVPNALSILMDKNRDYLKCAVLCYGYMLDDGFSFVADAAKTWGFTNPCEGKSVADLLDVPLLIARAGQDQMPHLNETIDRFMINALNRNLPITLSNHPTAPHAFDLFDDTEASRELIREILRFMQSQLRL
jgi:hypothetical protein